MPEAAPRSLTVDEDRRGRDAAIVLVALVAAGVAAWALAKTRTSEAIVAKAPIPPAPPAPLAPARTGGRADHGIITVEEIREEIEAERRKEERREIEGDERRAPLAPPDGPVRLSVKYVGNGDPPKTLVVYATPDGERGDLRVLLRNGATEGRLPAAKAYRLTFLLDGWTSDQEFCGLAVSEDQRLAIEVGLPDEPSVQALEAESGKPIPTARAHHAWAGDRVRAAPDAAIRDEKELRAGDDGRIVVERVAVGADLWVGAPDRAWEFVHVRAGERDRPVRLRPGGSIRVTVPGERNTRRTRIVATPLPEAGATSGRRTMGEIVFGPDEGLRRFRLDGLRPGRWRVSAITEDEPTRFPALPPAPPKPTHTSDVDVRAGELADVLLAIAAPPPPTRDVLFEVVVPPEWEDPPRQVLIRGASEDRFAHGDFDPRTAERGSDGSWKVRLKGVPVGPYEVGLLHFGFREVVWVRETTDAVRVVVPQPVSLRVRAVDDATGKPIAGADVLADMLLPPGTPEAVVAPLPLGIPYVGPWTSGATDATGESVLRVPPGRFRVGVPAEGYAAQSFLVTVASRSDEAVTEVRLVRAGTLVVRVLRGGRYPVLPPCEFEFRRLVADGEDDEATVSDLLVMDACSAPFEDLPAGRYLVRLRVPALDLSFERTVVLKAGEETFADFELPAR